METKEIITLYTLKQNANQHLKNKKYQHAAIYYNDILNKFQAALEKVESQDDMQKIIKELKVPAHKNLSLCYLKTSQYKKSVLHSQQTLKIQPNNVKILYRIGKALIALKKYNEAEEYLKRGFAIDPLQQQILKALEQIQLSKKRPQENTSSGLKKLIALILYWPLMILNLILTKFFYLLGKNIEEKKQN